MWSRTPGPFLDATVVRMSNERLAQQIAFLVEVDRLKTVLRRTPVSDNSRLENSAEHSWHLALAAMTLHEYGPEGVDTSRVLELVVVHDLVEIDAGDTFAYDQSEAAASKEAREQEAADRLFGLLPPAMGAYFRELWDEYERGDTPEGRYVMAVDRSAPMLLNITEGGSAWREYGITRERVIARNGPHVEPAIPALWAELMNRLDAATSAGSIEPV